MIKKNIDKIETLISLRFLAALMVVLLHSNASKIINSEQLSTYSLSNGVSLFFILSGFILTYVYPQLNNKEILPFIKARFARVWPAHIASLLLLFILVPSYTNVIKDNFYIFFITVGMINSWVPILHNYSTFNIPAWSLSTECFFYLCFPLLLYKLNKNWGLKLIITFTALLGMTQIFYQMHNAVSFDIFSTVYVHPLSRIFEFTLGMCTGLIYMKFKHRVNWSFFQASMLETISLISIIIALKYSLFFSTLWQGERLQGLSYWMSFAGSTCLLFPCFIFIIAFQKGLISRIIRLPIFILLGEISYSLYLLHYTFIIYFVAHLHWFKHFNTYISYSIYWLALLITSYLVYRFIEIPSRRYIITFSIHWPISKKLKRA